MAKTSGGFEVSEETTIYKEGERWSGYALADPINPYRAETMETENIEQEGPFHCIKCFFSVYFKSHQSNKPTIFFHCIQNFRCNNGVILDNSTRNKSRLPWGDDFVERGLSLVARIFEMILYMVLQRLIGQNWFILAALFDFGIKVMKVRFISVRMCPLVKKLETASMRSWLMISQ